MRSRPTPFDGAIVPVAASNVAIAPTVLRETIELTSAPSSENLTHAEKCCSQCRKVPVVKLGCAMVRQSVVPVRTSISSRSRLLWSGLTTLTASNVPSSDNATASWEPSTLSGPATTVPVLVSQTSTEVVRADAENDRASRPFWLRARYEVIEETVGKSGYASSSGPGGCHVHGACASMSHSAVGPVGDVYVWYANSVSLIASGER